jgi:hypothetical protein
LRITIGEKNLERGLVEIRRRRNGETMVIEKEKVSEAVAALIDEEMGNSLQA